MIRTLFRLTLVIFLSCCFSSSAQAQVAKLKAAYSAESSWSLATWTAYDAGFFKKYGLDVDLVLIRSAATITAALIAGETPMIQLGGNGQDDAAFGRSVELREHDAGDVDRLGELLRLGEAVLPGRRVEHEEHLGDLAGLAVGDAAYLLQLLHEVRLGVQPAGSVGEHEVEVTRAGALHRVEDDRRRVATVGAAHYVGTAALGPRLELLAGRGAERVARSHDAAPAVLLDLPLGDLADRRRLAGAVHADDEPHVRHACLVLERAIERRVLQLGQRLSHGLSGGRRAL